MHDILKPLEGTLCFNASGSLKGALNTNVAGGSDVDVPRKIYIAGTVRRILEDARKYGLLGADVGIQVDVSPTAWVWDTALACDTYAGVLRKLLGARPGMVCWVDYSGSSPVIRVADGTSLPVVTLDRAGDLLTAIDLDPRHDLVPPAVGLVLTAGRMAYQSLVWPRGRTVNTPKRWYRADKSGTTGPEDGSTIPDKPGTGGTEQEWPDYTGVLRDYYEITRQLPWEGTLQSLRALSPAGLVGRQLSITVTIEEIDC